MPVLFFLFPFFLILYEFCINMSNDMYLPALDVISSDFSVPLQYVQLTITSWFAGDSATQLFIGPLSDRFGRRPILFLGGLLFLSATWWCAAAPSLHQFIFARFIQGIGVCTMMVAGYAAVHDLYDDHRAIRILAWMGSAAVIAPAIGPALGGIVLTFTSWRVIFTILFFLAAFALLFLWYSMPESHEKALKPRLDVKAIARSYKNILGNGQFMASACSYGLLYAGLIGWITASPFLLIRLLHLSPAAFGWLQVPVFGSYIIGAQLIKWLMEKVDREKLISFGLGLALLGGMLLIILSYFKKEAIVVFIFPMAIYTLGFGVAAALLNRTTLTATQETKGAAIAIFYLTITALGTLVSLLLSLFDESTGMICTVIGSCVFLSFLLNLFRQKLHPVSK